MDCLISRRVSRHMGLLLAAVAFVPTSGLAQTPPRLPAGQGVAPRDPVTLGQPPRDRPPATPRVGTAVVKGRVVDGVTGNPIPRARVRLMNGAAMKPPVLTDGSGSFEFTGLPPGMHGLMVEKSTYLVGRYPEAARSLRAAAQPRLVRDGEVVEIAIPMFRGGAIAGRIFDAHGDPLDLAQVRVLRVRGGRPTSAGQAQTNDLGEYRVPRLQPGRYVLQVRPQTSQGFQDPALVETPLPQPVPTYYPNVLALSQAQPITVNRGETISGMDMRLAEGLPTLVTGTVLRTDGEAVSVGSVSTRFTGPEASFGFDNAGGTGLRPGGTFRLTLAPGEYIVEAQVPARQGPVVAGPSEVLFGSGRITVGGGTVENVTITVGRGATATGKVVFEGSSPPPPNPGNTRIPLYNPNGPGCRVGEATFAADWTFKLEGLNGTCGAQPSSMFGRWTLKALTIRGQDLMDHLVTFESGQQYTNMQLVVTDRRTQMDLRVSGDDGQPTREYVAIAFPTDKEKWTSPLRQVRTYVPQQITSITNGASTMTTTSQTVRVPVAPGTVTGMPPPMGSVSMNMTGGMMGSPERFVGLPPGEYYVIAVDDMEIEDSQDPAVLERLTSSAIRVTLTDEAPLEVPLRRFTLADVVR